MGILPFFQSFIHRLWTVAVYFEKIRNPLSSANNFSLSTPICGRLFNSYTDLSFQFPHQPRLSRKNLVIQIFYFFAHHLPSILSTCLRSFSNAFFVSVFALGWNDFLPQLSNFQYYGQLHRLCWASSLPR
jgi:hypothetical protein